MPKPTGEKYIVKLESPCWDWPAVIDSSGYGRIRGKKYAHRVAYETFVGPIPEGLVLDHRCHNRRCINPNHLEAVTQGVNALRSLSPIVARAKRTHCPAGHPYSGVHLQLRTARNRKRPYRTCRTCRNKRHMEWYWKNREAAIARMRRYKVRLKEERVAA